jgi:signal transduction histidine kinase
MATDMLMNEFEENGLDEEYVKSFHSLVSNRIEHIITTLNEFRSFFRPNSKIERVKVSSLVDSSQMIVQDELNSNSIVTEFLGDKTLEIETNPNEFKHIIINIINNAKDAFNDNHIPKTDRKIVFNSWQSEDSVVLSISDSAGGIKDEIMQHIFEPHFTTKEESKGTGIGLYITKQIVEKNGAKIEVSNAEKGAVFSISVPKK